MRVCVVAGMIDAKLHSKMAPLQNSDLISEILLVRRSYYQGNKIILYQPPAMLLRVLVLAEVWRFLSIFYIAIFKRPAVFIAFGTVPHGLYLWLLGKLFRIPVIQHVMGKNDLRQGLPDQKGQDLCLRAVKEGDLIAVRGERMKSWLYHEGVAKQKIFKPQNVHDFSLFSPGQDKEKKFDLIYVGLLSPYKRIEVLLRAFAMLCRRRPHSTLLLVGDGSLRPALTELTKSLGLADRVTFTGKKDFHDLPAYLRLARVFIMTSLGDGLPMAMIEAMSCGLPAIVPADADILEVAIHQENALIVELQEEEAYCQSAERLLNDAALYKKLAKGALQIRDKYRQEYSLEYQTTVWTDALKSIVS